ncbi:hypothetical protein PVV54_09655 [Pseudomonas sp. PSKL.D1]|nr:hypothetical protein [Pseudomonas sp. PSKL.D1]WDY59861.1 hypothetical protein PVV54_09655 [Pseudomonas sp. PSKL.D1]
MTQWRSEGFWKKAWAYAGLAALLALVSEGADVSGLGGGSSNRKRVFSPGFIALCVVVVVVELLVLQHLYRP